MLARSRPASTCVLLVLWSVAPLLPAAEPRPSWECLPDDTALMVRMPGPAGFLEAVRAGTRFGAVVLDEPRLRAAADLLLDSLGGPGAESQLEELDESLAKYGLDRGDMAAAATGDCGVGVVVRPRERGLEPLVLTLAWMEPGKEAAERIVAAFKQALGESEGPAASQRIDLEMAGHDVVWAVTPLLQPDLRDLKVDADLDEAGVEALRRRIAERARTAPPIQTGQVHGFVARIGGRLLAGQTLPSASSGLGMDARIASGRLDLQARVAAAAGGDDRDFDRESGTDEARSIVARYLAAHDEPGDAPLAAVLQGPGIRDVLPAGTPLGEVVLDPRVLLRAYGGDPGGWTGLAAASGVTALGPIAWRQSLDGGRLRQGLFVTLPAPREGFLRVLDQECDPAAIPSFVTGEAVDLTQISLDLGSAYRTVREIATAAGGEETANVFTTLEMQAVGWLGVELPAVLSGLGSRHWIVSYPPDVSAALAESRQARAAEGALEGMPAAERRAVVWQVADEAPFVKLVQRLAGLAQQEMCEEQGFRGVRLPGGGAAFVGQGHLVLAIGADALDRTLVGIRTPPAGPGSLRDGDVFRRADEMLGLGPARAFSVSDSSRTGGMLGTLRELAVGLLPTDVPPAQRPLLARLQALLPSGDEIAGLFGVGGAIVEMTDEGIAIRSAWEMPAP